MAERCGCKINRGAPPSHPPSYIVHCPKHAAADDVLTALEGLLTVQPRPVKIPGTAMNLTVSYTEGDLLKMETATAIAAKARGGAPQSYAAQVIVGAGQESPVWKEVLGQQE